MKKKKKILKKVKKMVLKSLKKGMENIGTPIAKKTGLI